MILDYKVEQEESKFSDWRIIFELEIISFGLLLAYHAIVSVCHPVTPLSAS